MARSVMYSFGDGTKEWHVQATATFFFFLGSLPPGVAVNKINIHIFYSHTFPPMCCAPGRAANFYPNLLIDDYHRFVSERGLGPFVFASCVCDVTA